MHNFFAHFEKIAKFLFLNLVQTKKLDTCIFPFLEINQNPKYLIFSPERAPLLQDTVGMKPLFFHVTFYESIFPPPKIMLILIVSFETRHKTPSLKHATLTWGKEQQAETHTRKERSRWPCGPFVGTSEDDPKRE